MRKIGVLLRFVKIAVLLSAAAGIAFPGKAFSQAVTYSGTVYTAANSTTPVAGVTVTIQDAGGNINLVTDANGAFSTTLGTPGSGYRAIIGTYQMATTATIGACSSCHGAGSMSVYGVAPVTSYTVSASAGTGGSVTPATRSVASGSTGAFTVTPNSGYTTDTAVTGTCGAGSWNGTTYTTGAVNAACSVAFSFTAAPGVTSYTASASAGAGGSVTPASQSVTSGSTAAFTVTPNAGYTTDTAVTSTCGAGSWNGTTYTTGAVTAACSVSFSFTASAPAISFTASASAGTNGSVTPANQNVTSGSNASFTVTPNAGYFTNTAVTSTCGTGSWNGTTYTTGAVTADCSVSFSFAPYAANRGSLTVTISPAGAVTAGAQWKTEDGQWQASGATLNNVKSGKRIEIKFKKLTGWKSPVEPKVTLTAGQTTAAVGVYTFVPATYSVRATENGGSVKPERQTVSSGGSATFIVKAESGRAIPPSVGGTCPAGTFGAWANGSATYTITGVTGACSVSFTFTKSPVSTGSASVIGMSVATLNGKVANQKNATVAVSFEYGSTNAYGTTVVGLAGGQTGRDSNDAKNSAASDSGSNKGGEGVSMSAQVSGLTCNTLYHFRVVALYSSSATPANGNDATFKTRACAVSDFDGDGKSDILLRDAGTGQTQAWLMNGATVASTVVTDQNAGVYDSISGLQAQGGGDFDGDGKSDVLWRDATTGDLSVWTTINGTTIVAPVTGAAGPGTYTSTTGLQVQGIGDFNGDGKSDILWRDAVTGDTSIWFMNGAAVTSVANTTFKAGTYTSTTGWQVQGIGDFNGDGKSDILWRDAVTGKTYIWFMNGSVKAGGGYTESTAGAYTSTTGLQVQGIGDFNGDGKSDILWRDAVTGKTAIWFMKGTERNGGAVYTSVQPGVYSATTGLQIQEVGDFNGDGKSDILFRDAVTGDLSIWLMNGAVATANWTSVPPGAYTSTTGLLVISEETVR